MQQGDTFDVVVVGFEARDEPPEARLQRVFGLDPNQALQLIAELPRAVQHAVPRVRAEYFRRALVLCGARVEVRDEAGRALDPPEQETPKAALHAATAPSAQAGVLANATSSGQPEWLQPTDAAHVELDLRGPAHPTLREAALMFPGEVATSVAPHKPNPRTQVDVLSVSPAAGARAARTSEGDPLAPRVPSSVWDPLPPAAAPAAAPELPPLTLPDLDQPQFDLAKSVIKPGLWRPPATSDGLLPSVRAAAITFEPATENPELRVMPAWELPRPESMAEPSLLPSAPPPRASARANERAAPNSARARPPKAPAARREPVQREPLERARTRTRAREAPQRAPRKRTAGSFWSQIGATLAAPFSGRGPAWILAISAWAIVVGLLDALRGVGFGAGLLVMFAVHSALLTLACDFYRICFWAQLSEEKGIEHGPDFDPSRIIDRYFRAGGKLGLFAIVMQLPAIAWLAHASQQGTTLAASVHDPVAWSLLLLPSAYWPMALATAAIDNNFGAVWNFRAGLRAIARAPLEYLTILAIGAAVLGLCWSGLLVCGALFGHGGGGLISGTLGLPLALSHGLCGALMGHLARAKSELFE